MKRFLLRHQIDLDCAHDIPAAHQAFTVTNIATFFRGLDIERIVACGYESSVIPFIDCNPAARRLTPSSNA
jgi:hypothetical protein